LFVYNAAMQLDTWQDQNNVDDVTLADGIEVHPSFLSHYKAGRRNLSPATALRIEIFTGGAVTRMELLYPEQTNGGR
jgi:DNA-binding transcriptional regulator YdaS (Cro superfamily)